MGKCEDRKKKDLAEVDPIILSKVKSAAKDGRISCAEAFRLASEMAVPVRKIGEACDAAGIKLSSCQLGCF